MAYTKVSNIYGAVHENLVNVMLRSAMRQRPSLFNYATANVARHPELLCVPIEPAPMVKRRGDPLVTIEDPIPVVGTDGRLAMDFCLQINKAELDFSPGGLIGLPPELDPLPGQSFSIRIAACGGIGCPTNKFLDGYELPAPVPRPEKGEEEPPPELTVVPIGKLECFCLDLALVGHFEPAGEEIGELLRPRIDAVEIIDVSPEGLENSLECYLHVVLQVVVMPELTRLFGGLIEGTLARYTTGLPVIVELRPTPLAPGLDLNPEVDKDRLGMFIDLEVSI